MDVTLFIYLIKCDTSMMFGWNAGKHNLGLRSSMLPGFQYFIFQADLEMHLEYCR